MQRRNADLWERYQQTRSVEDRNALVEANMPLMRGIAAKSWVFLGRPGWITVDELESMATEKLIRAVELFDMTRGFQFSTYATYAIRNEISRQLNVHNELPTYFNSKIREEKGIKRRVSISALQDKGWQPPTEDDERAVHCDNWIEKLRKFLPERYHKILVARYGDGLTLEEAGVRFGVTRERIRQIETKCLAKLRAIPEATLLFEDERKVAGLRVSEWADSPTPPMKEANPMDNPLAALESMTMDQVHDEIDKVNRRLSMLKALEKVIAARDGNGKMRGARKQKAESAPVADPSDRIREFLESAGPSSLSAIAKGVGVHHLTTRKYLADMTDVAHSESDGTYRMRG